MHASSIRAFVLPATLPLRIAPSCPQITEHFRRNSRQKRRMTGHAGKEIIQTDKAPAAMGPYSQATKINNLLYVSGQIGIAPGSTTFASEDIEGQTEQVLKNLGAILEAAGSSFDQVMKTTVLLSTMADFQTMNGIYGRYFSEMPPARACYAVKGLPFNAKVEIEAIALV